MLCINPDLDVSLHKAKVFVYATSVGTSCLRATPED